MPAFASCLAGWRRGPRLAPVLAGALIATAVLLPAADEPSPSPLEEVKVDLKALKHGDNPQLSGTPAGPKVSVPGFIPAQGAAAPPAPPPAVETNLRAGRRPANANWLLEVMELQGRARPSQSPGANALRKNEAIAVDASDPAYLLKLYLAQEAPHEGQSESISPRGEARTVKEIDVGTLDGFLKQWIAPRDLALFGLEELAQTANPDLLPPGSRTPAGMPALASAPSGAPNPFLEASKLDPLPAGLIPAAAPQASLPPPAAVVPPAPPPDSAPPAERNAPPSSTDDKKYFPQLKRF
jgi:hypothetical protein